MPSKDAKILEFNQYHKSDKTPAIIYVDLECLIKTRWIENRSKKIIYNKNIWIWKSNGIKTKHDVYRDKDCIKKFCKSLDKYAMEIINFEKRKWYH